MFRYGKKGGYMAIALIVLAVAPMLAALIVVPQLPATFPLRFDEAGTVTRWGGWLDIMFAPILCLLLSAATYMSAQRQARAVSESVVVAGMTYRRYLRNGLVAAAVLAAYSFYSLYAAVTGTGMAF